MENELFAFKSFLRKAGERYEKKPIPLLLLGSSLEPLPTLFV